MERGRYFQRQKFHNRKQYAPHRPEISLRPDPERYPDTVRRRAIRLGQVATERSEPHTPERPVALEFGNKDLPAYEKKSEFLELIDDHRVVIVVGPTGSGKSTQIPQFLYQAGYSVALTQPRIMAANNVGARIESELAEVIGVSQARDTVGVQTSEMDTTCEQTKITVLTDGLRLAQMTSRDGTVLDEVLVVDEVHEWNMNIELTVSWAKKLLKENTNLRIVIMSATVDAHALASYFADATGDMPPVVEIEGRTFPVARREAPNSTIVQQVVEHCETSRSILIFVPGLNEINDTIDNIRKHLPPEVGSNATILPLHAKMNKREQDRVMLPTPGLKIIVATNVAQTSLTIPGVDMVIDSGLERRTELDEEDNVGLELHPCSRAEMDQRAGRTGRDVPGTYIHTRYDNDATFISYMSRQPYSTPEVRRTDVSRGVLRTAAYGQDFAELDLFHPIKPHIIRRAKDVLFDLGALDDDEQITGIGEYMNRFPLRPSLGRMMYEASRYSEGIRMQMAGMVASVEAGGLPRFGADIEKRWKKLLGEDRSSDMLAQLDLFISLHERGREGKLTERYLTDHDFDHKNVSRAMTQYQKVAQRANVTNYYETPERPTEQEREILLDCIYAGMANTAFIRAGSQGKKPTYRQLGTNDETRLPSNRSVAANLGQVVVGWPYRVQIERGGELQQLGIVEYITNASVQRLARVAFHLCSDRNPTYSWNGDELRVVTEQLFAGEISTGVFTNTEPSWSAEVQGLYIQKAFESQGPFLKDLLALKRKHEKVARRSKEPLPVLTKDIIEHWMREVSEQPLSSVGELDGRLRQHAADKLGDFISEEEQARIVEQTPDELEVRDGWILRLSYSQGIPTARGNFTSAEFGALGTSCRIPRGDEVRFYFDVGGHRRPKTLAEIDQLI